MQIGIVYNARPTEFKRDDPLLEKHIEGDEWKTIEAIGQAVEKNGHHVSYFPIDVNIYETLKLAKSKLDLVFNLSEGVSGGADREAQVPMICQILEIPHTGPKPLASALILDKSRAKEIWRANNVPTADWQVFDATDQPLKKTLSYPLIVKPNNEGSGIGIKSSSIVTNDKELRRAVQKILTDYHQNALVEAYLSGREFTVAIIGNGEKAITLPIVEINFDAFPPGSPKVDTYEAKFIYGATGQAAMHETEFCPAIIDASLANAINLTALKAYHTIGCLDFGRVDLRLDHQNKVHVMEINHPPGLMSDPEESSFFTIAGRASGLEFDDLIGQIIKAAISRLSLLPHSKNTTTKT